jgi:hypothetical protein
VTDTQARLAHERDYIARTIATVRNHKDADNCWPQWANIFADQIESLEAELERVTAALQKISAGATGVTGIPDRDRLVGIKQEADRALAGGARAAQEGDV